METFKDYLKKYAEHELKLIGFDQTEFGKATVTLLETLADLTKNNPEIMKQLCLFLPNLVDCNPISPITEADFVLETYTEGDCSIEILRCTRYPYVYKMGEKYYNDRAVAFRSADSAESDRMYLYQLDNSSKQQVTLPYYPSEEVRILQQEYTNLPSADSEPNYEVE
jgi:hypothetical protein